jgi:RNA polymerase sigma-70 factor (ECF subfamily)
MNEHEWLAERFEQNRRHLRTVAYRLLGSHSEADDAVQETWLRLSRSNSNNHAIENLGGWLTTVVAHVCLDILRSRSSRREEPLNENEESLGPVAAETIHQNPAAKNPEQEALMADSLGLAVLIVLEKLNPAERLAFVLHDMFAVSFDEIGTILNRTPESARQLASRARRRVRGSPAVHPADLAEQQKVVNAFLQALRAGDFRGLLAVLDPDVVVRLDESAARADAPREIHGAENWARGAIAFSHLAHSSELMLVDGTVGLVSAPQQTPRRALKFLIVGGKIVAVDVITDLARIRETEFAPLDPPPSPDLP